MYHVKITGISDAHGLPYYVIRRKHVTGPESASSASIIAPTPILDPVINPNDVIDRLSSDQ